MEGDWRTHPVDDSLVEPLVRCLDDPQQPVRAAALRVLVRLPLSMAVRTGVHGRVLASMPRPGGGQLVAATPSPPTFTPLQLPADEIVEAAAFVPRLEARDRLEELGRAADGASRLQATLALARTRDVRALPLLLELLRDPATDTRVRSAECLWWFDLHKSRSAVERFARQDPYATVRFWCALAAARSGSHRPLEELLRAVGRGKLELDLLYGDPSVIQARLRGYPVPLGKLRDCLLGLSRDAKLGSDVRELARHLVEEHGPAPDPAVRTAAAEPSTPAIAPESERAAVEAAAELLRHADTEAFGRALYELHPRLSALPPSEATALVSRLVGMLAQVMEAPTTGPMDAVLLGNAIVSLVAGLSRPLVPDIAVLVASARSCTGFELGPPAQLAWLAARGGLPHLLRGIAAPVASDDAARRLTALSISERALRYLSQPWPPIFGGGTEVDDVAPPELEPAPRHAPPPDDRPAVAGGGRGSLLGGLLEGMRGIGMRRGRAHPRQSAAPPREPEPPTQAEHPAQAEHPTQAEPPTQVVRLPVAPSPVVPPPVSPPVASIERDPVKLGASFPPYVTPGSEFVVRVVAYVPEQEQVVAQMLHKLSQREVPQLGLRTCHWARGTKVAVTVSATHLKVEPAQQDFTWEGGHNLLDFDVTAPQATPPGPVTLHIDVAVEGFPLVRMRPEVQIAAAVGELPRSSVHASPATTAFASYASEDRQRVLDRVAAVQIQAGLDVFLDCLSLHPGEQWKPRLEQEIRNRELFLLFWSKPAADSQWVTWEWKTALTARGIDAISLHPLQTTAEAPPPSELRGLHFNDVAMLVRKAYDKPAPGSP